MINAARTLLKNALKHFDLALTSYSRLQWLEWQSKAGDTIDLLLQFPEEQAAQLLKILPGSKSQLRQDLFVLSELNLKQGGFFVEFGAANGIDLSNTYLLEKHFAWRGILAEPARCWHSALAENRSCHIETDCVWRDSNATLIFTEAGAGELSTISSYASSDLHSRARKAGTKYSVRTISLMDLLDRYRAPRVVDYLSIDTEGSEYEILEGFDFSAYQFRVITCEHNFSPQREQMHALLTRNGYHRKLEKYSAYDDWYVGPGSD